MKAQIIVAAFSAFFLLIATWMATLQIPRTEDIIKNEDSKIVELRHEITKDLVNGLYAMDMYTERRIDFLDVRLEAKIVSSKSQRKEELIEGTIRNTIGQIQQWDSLFIGEDAQLNSTPIPLFHENTPAEQKIITLDPVLSIARRNAYSRLRTLIDQVHAFECKKNEYYNLLKKKQLWFRIFQIMGLLLLAVSIMMEAYSKWLKSEPIIVRERDRFSAGRSKPDPQFNRVMQEVNRRYWYK